MATFPKRLIVALNSVGKIGVDRLNGRAVAVSWLREYYITIGVRSR